MIAGTAADVGAVTAGVAFGFDEALAADCAHANGANAMLIPVSTARRFTFRFKDNHLSRIVRVTDTSWKFLVPVWLPFLESTNRLPPFYMYFAPRTLHPFALNLYSTP